jgi:uncharacterized membrane protein YtjA (UPF0391 family)
MTLPRTAPKTRLQHLGSSPRPAIPRGWNRAPIAAFFSQRLVDAHVWRSGSGAKVMNLLHWAVIFLVVAIVAAALGFGGVAGTAMEGARIFVWIFLILFIVSLIVGLLRRG